MKTGLYLLALLLGSASARAPFAPRIKTPKNNPALAIPRGGDLGKIKGETLAQVFACCASLDALGGALVPISSMKWAGVDIESGSFAEHSLHGIAASAATTAISLYLAVTAKTSTNKAIAYGLVARMVSMAFMIVTGKYQELGMRPQMFLSMMAILAVSVYSLFTGNWEPLAISKVVALLLAFHGVFLYLKPEVFLKKSGADEDDLAKSMASIDGAYMFTAALVTGLLAMGVEPVKVAGYASLTILPIIVKVAEVVVTDKFFGIPTGDWAIVVVALMAAIATGTIGGSHEAFEPETMSSA